ncbi:MAG: Gfo/Idh/MocA family protein [Vicinamibacterales bacterium]
MTPLRVAVAGVGYLGQHHARILGELPGVRLCAVVDSDLSRAREVAGPRGAAAMERIEELEPTSIDALTIATPTSAHVAVARTFLQAGVPVLVEKPMTRTLAEADELIALARTAGVPLAVGHTERFNPAVTAALPLISSPGFVEVHRLGTFPERSLDIDVVFDLMIHDLDVLLSTVPGDIETVDAVGVPVLTRRVDIANARIRFSSGCIANVTASRISRDRVRKVRFFQRDAYVSIDYSSQEVEHYALLAAQGGAPAITGGRLEVSKQEPLRLELQDFIDAVRTGGRPRVTGEDGRRALALAQTVVDRIAAAPAPMAAPPPAPAS